MDAAGPQPTFVRLGPPGPSRAVVLAVPHAGRDYPDALIANALVSRSRLEGLEDRHADALIAKAVEAGTVALVACRPRSWLDLNRDEREIDPATVYPPPPAHRLIQSAKLRGGLGLIPRRMPGAAELWRAPLAASDLEARIAGHHRPFHAAITDELGAARSRHGAAMLIDVHSMPPVAGESFGEAPQVVIGDRYGRSAPPRLIGRIAAIVREFGLTPAHNAPYAGGYTLDRHARPERGVYGVQIEIDRTLYLAPDRRALGFGVSRIAALIAAIVDEMVEALVIDPSAIAAE